MLGRTITHYRVLARLGEGGMGVVYLAEDLVLKRRVALKFLPVTATAEPEARARLVHEAQAAAALLHPNVCPVYEIAEADGQSFIAMAYLEGRTLRERLGEGPVPLAEALGIARQLAEGLAAAHARGIVHRDVKPGNAMLLADGRAVLTDFGLAHMAEATRLTRSGSTLGTVAYMAPELECGEAAGTRSDVWALGVVLYEMATGRLPFTGEHEAAQLFAILNREPEPLSAVVPGLPAGLSGIVTKALAKDPGRRYRDASELAADLAALERDLTAEPAGRGRRTRRRRRWLAAAVALGAVALLAGAVALNAGGVRERLFEGGPHIRALAVLPLANLSGDPEQEYFADGMTGELIDELATIGSLRVISRTSSMVYKGVKKPLSEIARALHVDAVVAGTVARSGDRVRITAELVQAQPERHLWGDRYERAAGDVLTLQSEMARAIAEKVRAQVTPAERARLVQARTVDPAAHEAYLRGKYLLGSYDQARCRAALEEFQRATTIAPGYAEAWAGMASAYYALSDQSLAPGEAMPRAREAARRAVQLDEQLAEGHATLGVVLAQYDRDWGAAEAEYLRAIALNASSSNAHLYYGFLLSANGRFDEALREHELAYRLDPLARFCAEWEAWTYFLSGRYEAAVARYRALAASDPTDPVPHYSLAACYIQQRRPDLAIQEIERSAATMESPYGRSILGCAYAAAGRRAEALDVAAWLQRPRPGTGVQHVILARVYAALGDREAAFTRLERALANHEEDLNWLKVDSRWAPLRGDPRFDGLLRQLRLD